jgi:hypothetical protein
MAPTPALPQPEEGDDGTDGFTLQSAKVPVVSRIVNLNIKTDIAIKTNSFFIFVGREYFL